MLCPLFDFLALSKYSAKQPKTCAVGVAIDWGVENAEGFYKLGVLFVAFLIFGLHEAPDI